MSFFEKMINMFEETGRARALSYLRLQSDTYLEDLGYSPKMVNQGLDAWPWREDDDLVPQVLGLEPVINPVPAIDYVEPLATTENPGVSVAGLANSPRY